MRLFLKDLLVLKNYLWNKPEEISVVAVILKRICENPIGDRINELTAKALEIRESFNKRKRQEQGADEC